VFGQTYGIELHNSLMPASSGMGGASFTQPQDIQSAIYGNPATLTRIDGTQFSFGGGWAEPTVNVNQATPLPLIGVTPYQAKSQAPGSMLGNIGVVQDLEFRGMPVKIGLGFKSNAGLGIDFRQMPESNGSHSFLMALDVVTSLGIQVSERLSLGAAFHLGTGIMDGPFVNATSSQIDYAGRGSFGLNFDLGRGTSFGAYYQTKKSHTFDDLVRFGNGPFQAVDMDLPNNFGMGIANSCFMNGRLLLATDVLFKQWSEAQLFQSIYDDQWVFQFGAQYIVNPRLRLRLGYAFNENPSLETVPGTIGGVIPVGGIPAVQYIQGQFPAMSQHRMTGGFGIRDIMPNVDLDLSLGGMFEGTQTFGSTTSSVKSYWTAFGLTWRCGRANQNRCSTCAPSDVFSSTTQVSDQVVQ
jgi:long-chain fatty acid transport protein